METQRASLSNDNLNISNFPYFYEYFNINRTFKSKLTSLWGQNYFELLLIAEVDNGFLESVGDSAGEM